MKYRQLGKTELKLSEIGFGTWGLGGKAYGPTEDSQSILALKTALDEGINFFDTSNIYGMGRSERLLGQAFDTERKRVILSTKVGMTDETGKQDFSALSITKSLNESLKNLKTDYVDLLQLHGPRPEQMTESDEIIKTMESFKSQGKIRYWGVSLTHPTDGEKILKHVEVDSIQVNFNLVDQRFVDCGLMEFCLENKIGVIGRTPLTFGLLGSTKATDTFSESDHRRRWSPAQLKVWEQARELFQNCFTDKNQSAIHRALRFCLSYSAINTVIPGMLLREHVLDNCQASDLNLLSSQELECVRHVYTSNKFFVS